MADLSTTRNYNDGEVLVRADLDAFLDDIETFINVTKINDDNIQNSGITGSTKLLNQSVTETKLATNAISNLKIQDAAVTTSKIADANVSTAKLADAAVTTIKITDQNVTTAKIADGGVTTAKLAVKSVTDTILASDATNDALRAVSTDSIHDSAVTTPKINNGAVTPQKHSTNYLQATVSGSTTGVLSVNIGSFSPGGRPVMVLVTAGTVSLGAVSGGAVNLVRNDGTSDTTVASIFNSAGASFGTPTTYTYSAFTSGSGGGGPMTLIDTPAAGIYTYKLVTTSTGANSFSGLNVLLYEL
jgi:hypothetical protein